MHLIRIGKMFLNLDTITRILPVVGGMPGELRVFFAHGDCHEFDGADADALRAWLTENALDISGETSKTDDAIEQEIARLEARHAALFAAERWQEDLIAYAALLALKARRR
jgi:hypothetical protein